MKVIDCATGETLGEASLSLINVFVWNLKCPFGHTGRPTRNGFGSPSSTTPTGSNSTRTTRTTTRAWQPSAP